MSREAKSTLVFFPIRATDRLSSFVIPPCYSLRRDTGEIGPENWQGKERAGMEIPLLFLEGLPRVVALVFGAPTNYNGTGCITGGSIDNGDGFQPGRSPDCEIPGAVSRKKKVRYAGRSNCIDAKKKVRLIASQQWETVQVARDLGSPDIISPLQHSVTFVSIELFF